MPNLLPWSSIQARPKLGPKLASLLLAASAFGLFSQHSQFTSQLAGFASVQLELSKLKFRIGVRTSVIRQMQAWV